MTTPTTQYGRDTSATDRIRPGRMVEGGELLGQAAYRRLTTERGTLLDDPNYGLPIARWLGSAFTAETLAAIPGQIKNELLKDARLDSVNVVVNKAETNGIIGLDIAVDGLGSDSSTFELVVHVDSVTVQLLKLEGA